MYMVSLEALTLPPVSTTPFTICGPLCDRPLSDRLALVPAPLAIFAPFKFTLVAASAATSVFDAATV